MRLWLVAVHIALVGCSVWAGRVYEEANILEDNEFAEFEQFDADDELVVGSSDMLQEQAEATAPKASAAQQNQFVSVDEADEMIVEDEDNEFEHFQDPEEFEGFHDNAQRTEAPKITIKQMPILVRSRWDAYWMEFLLCCGIVAYGLSWAIGKGRNTAIALTFSKLHRPFLEENFTFIGEPISTESGDSGLSGWRREADHLFTMWCSGRTCCEGMLLTLKLIKRQDLVHLLAGVVKPSFDTLQIKVDMVKEDSDNFVMCVAQKKTALKLAKEMADLSTFCPERRPGDKLGLPSNMSVMSELAEATAGVLDTRVTAAINKYAHLIDYIHVSDQYSGIKQQEESTPATNPPDTQRSIIVGLILPCKGEGTEGGCEAVRPLLVLVFYLMEKLKRFKLSKEASAKSEKHRREVAEAWQRGAHAVRAEQAAQRREERRKQEKERIMAEDDPEKQRRWEKKEQKRQLKRKTPKMKQLKVKAL